MRTRSLSSELARLAARYQSEKVVPHCRACREPCCRLQTLVLELDWERLKGLWGVKMSRRDFDASLARGGGPTEIRAQEGRYYAFRRVCPGFDEDARLCRVYASSIKPPGCTDFPVYEEEGSLVADLRCEAVDLNALTALVQEGPGRGRAPAVRRDPDFGFLVSLQVRRARERLPP